MVARLRFHTVLQPSRRSELNLFHVLSTEHVVHKGQGKIEDEVSDTDNMDRFLGHVFLFESYPPFNGIGWSERASAVP
jgi:hypothetical protein